MGLFSNIRDGSGRSVRVFINYPEISSVLGQSAEEVYGSQPAMQAVVSFIARNIAQLPLKCYIRADDSDRQRDTTGVAPLLLANPNPNMTGYELVERLMSDFKIHGWALWYVVPSADSKSGWEIDPIPPAWVQSIQTEDGLSPVSFTVDDPETASAPIVLDASDCLMFKNYNPTHPMRGLSPVEALKDVLAEQISAWAFRNQAWKNGGRISSYITRPAGTDWSDQARDRFMKSWKSHYASNNGSDAGGTPVFEDGMELKTVQFNSKEAQWAEATTLSREDVAGVYHVNPAMVWSNDGQTYASVKENARQLYVDTLGPDLQMVENRINTFLLPKIGADPLEYVEFDIKEKLRGSFEEQAAAMQSATGAPWMSRAEARANENLPYIPGTDELIVPLNVVEGGLASPRDTAGNGYNSAQAIVKAAQTIIAASKSGEVHVKAAPLKSRGHPSQSSADEITAVLRKFFKRQGRSVLPLIAKSKARWKADSPDWFDADRWNSELATDLAPVLQSQATAAAKSALKDLQLDPDSFDEPRIKNYVEAMAQGRAEAVNTVTLRQLQAALDDSLDEDSKGSTPEGVFDKAETSRAENTGLSFATAVAGWGVLEACHQQGGGKEIEKTWIVTSGNPRASHAAMDGETVGYHDTFSNGAEWPGDTGALDADETCGCTCELEVSMS